MKKALLVFALLVINSQSYSTENTPLGKTDTQNKKYCIANSFHQGFGIDVAQESATKNGTDTYITCNWYSNSFKANPKTEIGFRIQCPVNTDIVHSGYAVGTESLTHILVTGSVAVPLSDGTDAGDVGITVLTENPKSIFQLLTFTLCRDK